jgi:hypothetical protein
MLTLIEVNQASSFASSIERGASMNDRSSVGKTALVKTLLKTLRMLSSQCAA